MEAVWQKRRKKRYAGAKYQPPISSFSSFIPTNSISTQGENFEVLRKELHKRRQNIHPENAACIIYTPATEQDTPGITIFSFLFGPRFNTTLSLSIRTRCRQRCYTFAPKYLMDKPNADQVVCDN